MVVDAAPLKNRVVRRSKSNELPANKHEKSKRQHHEQGNVQVDQVAFFKEIVRMLEENRS